jgi:hypothetical protein
MKTTSFFHITKIVCLALAAIGLTAGSSHAQYVLGAWQGSSAEGWVDWGTTSSGSQPGTLITDPSLSSIYSIVSGVVPGYAQSLQITKSGWYQGLSLELENTPGDMAAFFNNTQLSFTFSVPASTSTSGYSQLYALSIGASGGYWADQPFANFTETDVIGTDNNSSGQPNYYWGPAGLRSETVTVNYSSILPTLIADGNSATSGSVNLVFAFNNGGGAPSDFYINNVVLSTVPEPTTGALVLAGGAIALFLVRRRTAQ